MPQDEILQSVCFQCRIWRGVQWASQPDIADSVPESLYRQMALSLFILVVRSAEGLLADYQQCTEMSVD